MINLIPPSAKKEVKQEYRIRAISVGLFMCAAALLAVILLYIPTYFLIQTQTEVFEQEYTEASDQTALFKEAETAVTRANTTATLLTTGSEYVHFSSIIEAIEASATKAIEVSSFNMARKEKGVGTITIAGTANTRADLSAFKNALESHTLFKVASLPLSNLAKDKDIDFSITITPR